MISKRLLAANESIGFIKAIFTPPRFGCKVPFGRVFELAAVQRLVLPSRTSAQGWALSAIQVAMQQVATETWVAFEGRLERARVPAPQRPDYHKWTRFYLDFCHKYGLPPRSPTSLGPFLTKLAAKHQSVEQRHQAAHAISLLIAAQPEPSASLPVQPPDSPAICALAPGAQSPAVAGAPLRKYQAPELLPQNAGCLPPLGGEVSGATRKPQRSTASPCAKQSSGSGCWLDISIHHFHFELRQLSPPDLWDFHPGFT